MLAQDFLNHGLSFLRASAVLNQSHKEIGPHGFAPIYFSLVHALELIFKSFLLASGWSAEKLRKPEFRHDLNVLLQACKDNGMEVPYDVEYRIEMLNSYGAYHEFRYPTAGDKTVPDAEEMCIVGQELYSYVNNKIKNLSESHDRN